MRYIIDTNVFIDFIEDRVFSKKVQQILEDKDNLVYVCSESIREFIHLAQLRKITPKRENFDIFSFVESELGCEVKYVAKEHLRTLAKLPIIDEHKDPADRLIISQAITEKIPLISSDKQFPKYRKYGLDFIPNY